MTTGVEKLVMLVQEREPIYNSLLTEYNNKNLINQLWSEVADQMKSPVDECKRKWATLRNCYVRYLRSFKNSAGTGRKPKPWYLANAMAFLEEHIGKAPSKINMNKIDDALLSQEDSDEDKDGLNDQAEGAEEETLFVKSELGIEEFPFNRLQKRQRVLSPESRRRSPESRRRSPESFREPRIDLHRNWNVAQHPLLTFVSGLLPDYEQLTRKRQRTFKQHALNYLHQLLDEQESDPLCYSPAALSQTYDVSRQKQEHDVILPAHCSWKNDVKDSTG